MSPLMTYRNDQGTPAATTGVEAVGLLAASTVGAGLRSAAVNVGGGGPAPLAPAGVRGDTPICARMARFLRPSSPNSSPPTTNRVAETGRSRVIVWLPGRHRRSTQPGAGAAQSPAGSRSSPGTPPARSHRASNPATQIPARRGPGD